MKSFGNLKISIRIIVGFLLVAFIAGFIGGIGIFSLNRINDSYKVAYTDSVDALEHMERVSSSFQQIRSNFNAMMLAETQEDKEFYVERIANHKGVIDENLAKYVEMLSSYKSEEVKTELELIDAVQTSLITFGGKRNEIIEEVGMDPSRRSEAFELLKTGSELHSLATAVDGTITDLISYNIDYATNQIAMNKSQAKNSEMIMMIGIIAGVLLAILVGLFISRGISKPIGHLVDAANKLANGDTDFDLKIDTKDETGILAKAFEKVIAAINHLITDSDMLTQAALDGKLSTRADASKHNGEYRKIVEGVNNTLDAVIEPIVEASEVLGEMTKGNLHVSVKGNYKGDNAKLKNDLNNTISNLLIYVDDISATLTQVAKANLDVAVTADYNGDFIEIKSSLNNIINALNDDMRGINDAAEQVSAGSKQVSDASMALSQGATEQASSVEELTASLEEISSQTKLNAENSDKAKELAENAKLNAVEGDGQMKEMLQAMEEINLSSSNIYKIIKVIDDIAFQTNILALNAAVEAARAGQYGKGFAVVAEEVKTLAGRSANAAKETADMIEDSIKKSEGGTKIARNTAEALNKIVGNIEKVANLVSEIAVASNEQAMGIAQVNQGIMQVSQVVQANSATSEESAAASEELSSQAEVLKGMVSKFKLKQNTKGYNKFDELSPEVIKMFDKMSEKK